MDELIFKTAFLGDEPQQALSQIADVLARHVAPFLQDWWSASGVVVNPTPDDISKIKDAVHQRHAANTLPKNYEIIPELLDRLADSMRFNRRNFVNIHPSPFLPSILASAVVALQNPNMIVDDVSKALSNMETECVEWMATNLLALDGKEAWGNVVGGGTLANMTALLIARDYTYDKLHRPKPSRTGPRGITGQKAGVVIGSRGSHYSIQKSLWFLGLGSENVIDIPVCFDEEVKRSSNKEDRFLKGITNAGWKQRILSQRERDRELGARELQCFYNGEQRPFSLQPLASEIYKTVYSCFEFNVPLLACILTLGSTHTGTLEIVDEETVKNLRDEDIFIHVDAAGAGFAFVLDELRTATSILKYADSFTIDGHKLGLVHYPCGAVIFRDRDFLEQIRHDAPYLKDLAPTLEGSRPGTGIAALWIAQKTLGVKGYAQLIGRLLAFTKQLESAFENSGVFQILHEVHLNTLAVVPKPVYGESRRHLNKLVRRIDHRVKVDGRFRVNHDKSLSGICVLDEPWRTDSELVEIEALRIVITNPLVENSDARQLVDLLMQFLEEERANTSTKSP